MGSDATDRQIRREVGKMLWCLAKGEPIRADVRLTSGQSSAVDHAAVDLIELYEKSADCVLTELYADWKGTHKWADPSVNHFAYLMVGEAFDMIREAIFENLVRGGMPTFAIELRDGELVWNGELREPEHRNPGGQEWWIVARGTGTDESAEWASKLVREKFGIAGRVVNHSLIIPSTRARALEVAQYIGKRAEREPFYRDAIVTSNVQRTDPPDARGGARARRNPAIPSQQDYLGETLGAPQLNPGPTKHWYVFYWENLRERPKSYQGPFTIEASARTAMEQDIRKYGDSDRSSYRIKHLAPDEFAKIWGTPPVLSNPPAGWRRAQTGGYQAPDEAVDVGNIRTVVYPKDGAAHRDEMRGSMTRMIQHGDPFQGKPATRAQLITRGQGKPPWLPNPGAYVRVARMPTDDELARAWSYIELEFTLKEGNVDGEQWAEALAFGQRYEADATDRAVIREVKPQLTEVQWRQITRRANELLADQGEPLRYKE